MHFVVALFIAIFALVQPSFAESAGARIRAMGYDLPAATPPAGAVSAARGGNLLFVGLQLPYDLSGRLTRGIVGADITVDAAREAAKNAALNVLAAAAPETANLTKVKRIVSLEGFVACAGGETIVDPDSVIAAASQVMTRAFGQNGRHTRSAVCVQGLPSGVPVGISAVFELSN